MALHWEERYSYARDPILPWVDRVAPLAGRLLTRWGRGVSFHEFELVFDDFPANVVACNYEPELLGVREIHPEELTLARLLNRVRSDIPPSFSRYWLDLILAGNPRHPRRYFEPWSFDTTERKHVDYTAYDRLHMRGRIPGSSLASAARPPS